MVPHWARLFDPSKAVFFHPLNHPSCRMGAISLVRIDILNNLLKVTPAMRKMLVNEFQPLKPYPPYPPLLQGPAGYHAPYPPVQNEGEYYTLI
jgi:hypothetical protein